MAASTFSLGAVSSLSVVNLKSSKSNTVSSLAAKKLVPSNFSSSFSSQNPNITTKQSTIPTSTRSFICNSHANKPLDSAHSKVQEFHVYEMNERDRGSPVYLRLSNQTVNSLGDIVTFSNKLYTGDLQKRLGISAGILIFVKHVDEKNGDNYHAQYTMYFGDYGTIAIQGEYLSWGQDTNLAITGGTGIFEGVYGHVKLHQVLYPLKLFYRFYLRGIAELPAELVVNPVDPLPTVEAALAAKALKPEGVVTNFSD